MAAEPKKGRLLKKGEEVVQYVSRLDISSQSANTCYFLVLSFFPMLVLLLGMLRYTGLEATRLTDLVEGYLPDALMPAAERLILNTYRNSTGTIVSISVVTALWSASRGIYGLVLGLNRIYEVSENRGYWRTRGLSMVYTFAFLVVLVLTVGLNVFEETFLHVASVADHPVLHFLSDVVNLRFFVLLIIQTALFTAIFMVLPNRRNRLMDSLPGAIFAAIGWMIFTELYSWYITSFTAYANIFGSVYAVALSMLWLYCCISIVFYGGALNHYLAKKL